MRCYQVQVLATNTLLFLVLAVIFCLVTVSDTFNYNSNILDPLWFHLIVILSILLGLIRKRNIQSSSVSSILDVSQWTGKLAD